MRPLWIWIAAVGLTAPAAAAEVSFNRDIRPILSDKCYTCHGPDESTRLSGLRLDVREGAVKDLGGRYGILRGDAENSEVYKRLVTDDAARRMPPAYAPKSVTPEEAEKIRLWIEQGADWERHWAFLPPQRLQPPNASRPSWIRNPIDSFVLARLDQEGLKPSEEADRPTLIRRLAFDLTGLPPTPAEVEAFVNDRSPNAYEDLVDRLLASPRYGERMAIRWLDASRYADTNGYQTDAERIQWRWRDWVIDAFNANKPFDEFTIEQLAGDLLPNPTVDQIVATGFNRNHRGNSEGGIVPEEYLVEYVVDRVETASTVWLGLTMGCARCHDHKYDPLTQREFYQVYAFFNNIPERGRIFKFGNTPPMVAAPTRDQEQALAALDEKLEAARKAFQTLHKDAAKGQETWEATLPSQPETRWLREKDLAAAYSFDDGHGLEAAHGEPVFAPGKVGRAAALDGKRYFNAGDTASFGYLDRFTLAAWIYPTSETGAIIARTKREKSDGQDRGFGGYGLYLIDGRLHFNLITRWLDDGIRVASEDSLELNRWHHVAVTYDGSRFAEGVEFFVDGKRVERDIILDLMNQQTGVKEPLLIGAGGGLEGAFEGLIDEAVIYSRNLPAEEIAALADPHSLNEIAALPAGKRSRAQEHKLRSAFLERAADERIGQAWRRLRDLEREREDLLDSFPTVMVMQEKDEIQEAYLLDRGAYDAPREKVERGVPEVLPALPAGAPRNRMGFAQWLVSPDHPLTSRVTVNRFWQMLFGNGLVKTVEDFGSQGEWPTHPELLDWLAIEFIESGWDVKGLLKTMVMSATYRQSSQVPPELRDRDPENRLLARGPRVRLAAEMLRDQALAMSGLLVEQLGGPSVKPYQPAGLWKQLSGGQDYQPDEGDKLYRRSLYAFWKRTAPPPWMMNFDSAGREACVVVETRTNTPLQALNLMNDVTYLEAARRMAERMIHEGGVEPAKRLEYGFKLALAREPGPAERQVLAESLAYYQERFRSRPETAEEFLAVGESPRDESINPGEYAAYAAVASLILNLDETITKE